MANTVDPDETAHYEPSLLNLQRLQIQLLLCLAFYGLLFASELELEVRLSSLGFITHRKIQVFKDNCRNLDSVQIFNNFVSSLLTRDFPPPF